MPKVDPVDMGGEERTDAKQSKTPRLCGFPLSVLFILGNEFCERFSFYGMKAILVFYFTRKLDMSDSQAITYYHLFTMLCYFTPLIGAVLADSLLGRFRTIWSVSIIYAIGNLFVSFSAFNFALRSGNSTWLAMVGLLLIGLGTGGIKPCVSAFGGDQFTADQVKEREKFFQIFYIAINAGSLVSVLLTPILRADISCTDDGDCYPAAFGVPAGLMVVAVVLFILGSSWYIKLPPGGNVMVKLFKCIFSALKNKTRSNGDVKHEHWLMYADPMLYTREFVQGARCVLGVLVIFIPLPIFWALFDQTGSRWTLQAALLDGFIGIEGWKLKPDQIQALNPIFIVLLIPVFAYGIFPLMDKFHIPNTHLQRMAAGLVFCSISFVMAGFLQLEIEAHILKPPSDGALVKLINGLPCDVTVARSKDNWKNPQIAANMDSHGWKEITSSEIAFNITTAADGCTFSNNKKTIEASEKIMKGEGQVFFVTQSGTIYKANDTNMEKPEKGLAKIRLFLSAVGFQNLTANFSSDKFETSRFLGNISSPSSMGRNMHNNLTSVSPKYLKIDPAKYKVTLYVDGNATYSGVKRNESFEVELENGGVYLGYIYATNDGTLKFQKFEEQEPNSISMARQAPQYFVLTVGEVLFSPTGLAFAYAQSPIDMRSVMQAAFLLTVSFGNLIVFFVASLELFDDVALELFVYAGAAGLIMVLFSIMAFFYKYKDPNGGTSKLEDDSGDDRPPNYDEVTTSSRTKEPNEKTNIGYANKAYVSEEQTEF